MQVIDTHERELRASPSRVGELIDSLASEHDALWPQQSWPRMRLDRALEVGSTGGHGPIRYVVEYYAPGKSIKFRFKSPRGFDGYHRYEFLHLSNRAVLLRHTLNMKVRGSIALLWLLVYKPLHDALLEDSLTRAEASLGQAPQIRKWSPWVRFLRWVLSGGKASEQVAPQIKERTAEAAQQDTPEVIGIDHVYIAVSDLARSEQFYDTFMRVLGFRKSAFEIGPDRHVHYFNRHFGYVLRPAKTPIAHDAYAPGLHHLCLRMDSEADVTATATALRSAGIEASEPRLHPEYAHDYYATFVSDPDGIRLEITNYRQERRDRHDRWESQEAAVGSELRVDGQNEEQIRSLP